MKLCALLFGLSLSSSSGLAVIRRPFRPVGAASLNQPQRSETSPHFSTRLANIRRHFCSTPSTEVEPSTREGRAAVDFGAIAKYGIGLALQLSLIFGVLTGMDALVARFYPGETLPVWANTVIFYLFNINTSVFSPLPSQPEQKEWQYQKRIRPSWTPPGWVFAVMWPLFVFGTRAWTAARIVKAVGNYANPAVMFLMLHLTIANLWNTINNVERRLGVSVIALYALASSKAYTAYRFFQIDALAGKCLAATMTWLSAAAILETNTWLINPDPDTGKPEPLYPAKVAKWKTRFRWEKSSN